MTAMTPPPAIFDRRVFAAAKLCVSNLPGGMSADSGAASSSIFSNAAQSRSRKALKPGAGFVLQTHGSKFNCRIAS